MKIATNTVENDAEKTTARSKATCSFLERFITPHFNMYPFCFSRLAVLVFNF